MPKPVDLDRLYEVLEELLGMTWRMETESEAEEVEPAPMTPPPEEVLAVLRELTEGGFVFDIMEEARRIRDDHPASVSFADHLLELAGRFDMNQIKVFLRREGAS